MRYASVDFPTPAVSNLSANDRFIQEIGFLAWPITPEGRWRLCAPFLKLRMTKKP